MVTARIRLSRPAPALMSSNCSQPTAFCCTLLSPIANRRIDSYGGILANRMRYPLEVAAATRKGRRLTRAYPARHGIMPSLRPITNNLGPRDKQK